MKKNQKAEEQLSQENLEKFYQEQQNMFWEKIQKFIKDKKEKDTLLNKLSNIEAKLLTNEYNKVNLSTEEYTFLGSLAYLVGIDFTSNFSLKDVQENVRKRFENFNITDEEKIVLSNCLKHVKEENIFDAKEKLKNKILNTVECCTIHDLSVLRGEILSIIDKSIIPINMCNAIEELKSKGLKLTYQDFLKINSLLQVQCKFFGNQLQNIIKLYNNKNYSLILDKARNNFDEQKFSVIYLDSILAVNEIIKFSLVYKEENILKSVLLNEDISDLIKKEDDKTENVETETVEEFEKLEYKSDLTDAEMEKLMSEKPDEFFVEVVKDVNQSKEISTNSIGAIINEFVLNSEDFGQHIYTYIKANTKSEKRCDAFETIYGKFFKLEDILTLLNNEHTTFKDEYSKIVEEYCGEIEETSLIKIVDKVNKTIKTLILIDDNQKQYLLSQLVENGIKTYKQLQQILNLIESCDTTSSYEYSELYDFLKNDLNISKIFNNSEKLNELQLRLTYIIALRDWFKFFVVEEQPKEIEK